jgi:phosphoribosyl 1,2-cyclic phosphodiesterase
MLKTLTPTSDLRIHALASGSSGNAMLVQAGETNLLIDAGLPLRQLASHLAKRGVRATDLDAILLTHENSDHSASVGALARRSAAPILANAATLAAYAERDALPFPTSELPTGGERGVGCIGVRSFAVPHDAAEPVGYVLEVGNLKIAYAVDVGSVTPAVREALRGANLVVIEANHDLDWLWRGPYTPDMKARVASPTGHLSNADCADLLAARLEDDGPCCIWLAHLSRVNNSPSLAKRSVSESVGRQTHTAFWLEIALRDHPSLFWRSGLRAVQPSLL